MESERKEEILDLVKKAGNEEEYITTWDEKGIPKSKKKTDVARGKKSRKSGLDFESRVRKDLEDKGWVVCKWANNVEFEKDSLEETKK